jgi:hypothetical protein
MAAAASFHERLKAVPGLKAALVSDPEGVVLLQAGDAAHDEAMKKYAATFLLTAERASKLHLGKNKTLTALYGADRNSQPRAIPQPRAARSSAQLATRATLRRASARPPRAAENASVVHVSCAPLVLTLLAAGGANVGLLLDAAPDLVAALEPLRQTAELVATDVRATT